MGALPVDRSLETVSRSRQTVLSVSKGCLYDRLAHRDITRHRVGNEQND